MPPKRRVLLRLAFALLTSASSSVFRTHAAFERHPSLHDCGMTAAVKRRRLRPEASSFRSLALPCASSSPSQPHARWFSSALFSSLKFKNVEDLIDSYCGPNETLLIAFTAINCGPCKLQKHELASFQQRLGGGSVEPEPLASPSAPSDHRRAVVKLLAIDADKWPKVGKRFSVAKLPCLVILRDKRVVARLEGLTKADVLVEHVLRSNAGEAEGVPLLERERPAPPGGR